MKRVVVAVDGSALSERALPYAWTIAERTKAELVFVQSLLTSLLPTGEAVAYNKQIAEEPLRRLVQLADQARHSGLRASWAMPNAEAGPGILDAAKDVDADFIIMASHARSELGRLVFGSVSDWVVRHSTVPVLIVPQQAEVEWVEGPLRILVPLDGSEVSARAIRPAGQLAHAMAAEIVLVRAIDPAHYDTRPGAEFHIDSVNAYLEQSAGRLTKDGIPVVTHVGLGEAASEIQNAVQTFGAHLIAMATHSRSGVPRLVLGSTTDWGLRETTVPMFLIGPAVVENHGQRALGSPA